MSHGQLRALADAVHVGDAPIPQPDEPAEAVLPADPIVVTTAAEAGSQIMSVECYFRAGEKSSPIPTLLARARSYIGKDFETLLREFVPPLRELHK